MMMQMDSLNKFPFHRVREQKAPSGNPWFGKEMPKEDQFPVSEVPRELQLRILEKMDPCTRTKAKKCSKSMANLVSRVPNHRNAINIDVIMFNRDGMRFRNVIGSFPRIIGLPFSRITSKNLTAVARDIEINSSLFAEQLEEIRTVFAENGTSAERVFMKGPVRVEAAELAGLFELLKTKELFALADRHGGCHIERDVFEFDPVKNMSTIRAMNSDPSDAELFGLTATELEIGADAISSEAIAFFLKQWKSNERELKAVAFQFRNNGNRKNSEILSGLDAKVIWSEETHRQTIIGKVPLMNLIKPYANTTYSVCREGDTSNTRLLVQISWCEVIAFEHTDYDHLMECLYYVDEYKLLGYCRKCSKQFCRHFSEAKYKNTTFY